MVFDEYNGNIEVSSPSGSTFTVLTDEEKEYYEVVAKKYQEQNKFTNISDLQDLDRVLAMETMIWRWGIWLSQERDYDDQTIDLVELRKSLKDYSQELRQIKKGLGIDKSSRDKDKGEGIATYLENLRLRAKEFGVVREDQLSECLTLFQDLKALITLHENCDAAERKQEKIELTDIYNWVKDVAIPEFDRIDAYFRENSQKYWKAM